MRKKNKVLATALLYVFGWETVLAQVRPVASLPPPPTSDRMGLARGLAVPSVGHRAASTARTPVAPLPIRPGLPLPLAALGPAAASPAASTGPSFPEIRFDLNTWSREGDPSAGTWTVALDGASVIQPQRDDPSVFVSAEDEINTTLRGRLHVGAAAAADGGFVGFVLGYRAPLSTNGDEPSTVDFLLLDWKGRAETRSGFAAQEGLTLARVRGAVTDPVPVFWGHAGEAVTVLGSRYGSGRGWSADRDFAVEISYRRSRIRVSIDGVMVFDVTGSFPAGRFGFFTYGQGEVAFSGFTTQPGNQRPVAEAGPEQTAEAGAGCRAAVTLDASGSQDPDGDVLGYRWSGPFGTAEGSRPTVALPLGVSTISLTVDDGNGETDTDTVDVIGVDRQPPLIACPSSVAVATDAGQCSASAVPLEMATVSDNCSIRSVTSDAPAVFPRGTTHVTWTAVDGEGLAAGCVQDVVVKDAGVPAVTAATAEALLWPPDHELRDVGFSVSAADNCGPAVTTRLRVYSDEPDDSQTGDGNRFPDARIEGARLLLREERKGDSDGRVYLLVVTATDPDGNTGRACRTVVVPHGENQAAIASVRAQAATAQTFCDASGTAPPGFFLIAESVLSHPNQPPLVDAGPDQAITAPANSVVLNGTVSDDGLPADGTLTVEWSLVSGPGSVVFGSPTSVMTTATFGATGLYVLRLSARDGQLAGSDTVSVGVGLGNLPPVVEAGPDQAITLPANTVALHGSVTDDGRPNGAVSVVWSLVRGPDDVTFGPPDATETTARFTTSGAYVLRLSASDGELVGRDELTVLVKDPVLPTLAVADASVIEGHEGAREAVVTVSLSEPASGEVRAAFATVDGTATAQCDYGPRLGTVVFPAGTTSQEIRVPVLGDVVPEADETFQVTIGNAVGASVARSLGTVTIVNDDQPNRPPARGSDRFPPDGAAGVAATPTLTWSASDPDPGDAVSHDVYFGTAFSTTGQSWRAACAEGAAPDARAGAATAYDDAHDRLLVVGGATGAGSDAADVSVLANATATGGPSQWIALAPSGGGPGGRQQASAAYDPSANRLILFGGCAGSCDSALADAWVLTEANGLGGTPEWLPLPGAPLARTAHVSGYDPASNRLIVFGGSSGPSGSEYGDVWILKDANGVGSPTWELLAVAGTPPAPRSAAAGAYDPGSNRLIVFGGRAATGEALSDVWVLENANGLGGTPAWVRLAPAGASPAARLGASAAFEAASRRLILFGGRTASPGSDTGFVFGDAWLLTEADTGGSPAWLRLTPDGGPPAARLRASSAYSPSQNRLVVALGENEHLVVSRLADVWVLTDAIGGLPLASSGQGDTSFAAGPLSPDATYYWRTVARDGHGATNGNRFFRFTPGSPSLSIDDVMLLEGGSGTTDAVFTLRLSSPSTEVVTVAFTTADGSARAGEDYASVSGTATFPPGTKAVTVSVPVNGDHALEADETFFVDLSAPAGARLSRARGVGTILNDDLAANRPPVVDAGPDQTLNLPSSGSGVPALFGLTRISTGFNSPIGVDYHQPTNKVVMSVNYNSGGFPYNFELVGADGARTRFSNVSGLTDELKLATVRDEGGGFSRGGFRAGELFTGSGVAGVIVRVSPDGSTIQNPWVHLPGEPGLMRGSLYIDRTGVFGGDLIVVTTAGNVWRVTSAGQATRLAGVGTHLEGLITVPDDPVRYGPWAGKILAGAEQQGRIYAIDAQGNTSFYAIGINPEDIEIVPPNENFFGVDFGGQTLWGAPAAAFRGMVGDFVIAQESPGILWWVRWTGIRFETAKLAQVPQWEHITFAPAGIVEIAPTAVTTELNGSVTDDGLPPGGTLTSTWSEASGPGSVSFGNLASPATTATFTAPGSYVVRLTASDSELSASDEATITILANRPPAVDAGPDRQITLPDAATLNGSVADDGLPLGSSVSAFWTKLLGPGRVTFDAASANAAEDFSTAANPSGVWSYGFTPTRGGTFTRYPASGLYFGLPAWLRADPSTPFPGYYPVIAVNNGSAPVTFSGVTLPAGMVDLHPGPTGQNSVLRFTAPSAGAYLVEGRFQGIDNTTSDVAILVNSTTTVLARNINGLADGVPFFLVRALNAGDTLDFSVGFGSNGNFNSDSTGLAVTITAAGAAVTSAGFSAPGSYVLRLVASDSELTASDEVVVTVNPTCAPPPSGMAGWWPAESDGGDLVSGEAASLAGDVTFGPGRVGEAFSFGAAGDGRITAAPTPALSVRSLTLDAWIFPTDLSQQRPIVEYAAPTGWAGVHLWLSTPPGGGPGAVPGTLYANLRDGSVGNHLIASGPNAVARNQWNHVALTYDQASGAASLYVNGSVAATANLGAFVPQTSLPFNVGFRPDASNDTSRGFRFLGRIDEVEVFSRALSPPEIQAIAQAGPTGKCRPQLNYPPTVDAGPDRSLTLPATSTTLNGSASDDGFPLGASFGVSWSKVSGPGTVTFADASRSVTTASFSAPGRYVLRLTASDSELTSSDDAVVTLVQTPGAQPGGFFITGHDPDFHAIGGPNTLGAQHFIQRGVAYVTFGKPSPRMLLVTDVRNPGGGFIDSRQGVASAGFSFDVADYGSGTPGVLDLHTVNFSTYDVIVVASDFGGWLRQDEANILNARASELLNFVNAGGGVVAFAESGHLVTQNRFGFLPFIVSDTAFDQGESGITLTATGLAMGLVPSDVNGNFSHNIFRTSGGMNTVDIDSLGHILSLVVRGENLTPGGVGNEPPAVDAGPDQTITLPTDTATLGGSVSDDGLPTGGSLTAAWTKVAGPGDVVFGSPGSAVTTASFAAAGKYVLRLTASDSALSTISDVIVTVRPSTNRAPTVNAGPDRSLTLPDDAVTLAGAVSDDGLPAGGGLTIGWSKVSGPGSVTFGTPGQPVTTARFGAPGVYVLRLSASDSVFTTSDDVRVTLAGLGGNQPPSVNAGPDQTITLPADTVTLHAVVGDDGLPPSSVLDLSWTKVSGPGTVIFGAPDQATTTATFVAAGSYVLRLTASDSELTASDDVAVSVRSVGGNQAPVVDAGADQIVTLPAQTSATLRGTVADDGLPDGGRLTASWRKLSGPGNVAFGNPAFVVTSATFDTPGSYVLELAVGDSELTGSDTVQVTVNAANRPPVVNAGSDQSITLPATSATLSGSATDDGVPAGGPVTVSWAKLSGPGSVAFDRPTSAVTVAAFDAPGTYVLRLVASDSQLTASDDVTVTLGGAAPVGDPPAVSIASPSDGGDVTMPTDVGGSVSSATLFGWRLEYRLGDDGPFTALATGSTPVTSGVLGRFDPTLLLNGTYELRLTATDLSARTQSASIHVAVRQNQKVGNLAMSFVDLEVPLAGLPIRVTRTYDSRDKRVGDFGFGWRLDLSSVRIEESGVAGSGWQQTRFGGFFPTYCVIPDRPHIVTLTLPDGRVQKFEAVVTPDCQVLFPPLFATVSFRPLPGSLGTLAPASGGDVLVVGSIPGPADLFDGNSYGPFDPDVYRYTAPDGRSFVIDQASGLRSLTDLNGNTLTVGPDGIGHSTGRAVAFTRDAQGRITAITDPAGNRMTYAYDANGDLVSYSDREASTTTFTYNATHGLLEVHDPRGIQPLKNEYDDAGRLVRHTDAFGKTVEYTHDVDGRQEVITDRLGSVRQLEYDPSGNVVREVDGLGRVTLRTFDGRGNRTSETDPLGNTTTFAYDAQDNPIRQTDALGNATELTYNARKQLLTTKDPLGRMTTSTYDAAGNVTSTTDGAGNATSYTYDGHGNVASRTDALGCVTQYEYDAFGSLTKETHGLGNITTFTHDANGNRLSQARTRTTAAGVETLTATFEYDKQNRLVRTTDPDGRLTRTVYDALGKQSQTIDKLGRPTLYEYDAMGRLTRTTHPDGTTDGSTYDAEGRRLTAKDRAGRVTSYEYDALGQLLKTTYPDGASSANEYDADGRLIATRDGRGKATVYGYDKVGRRVSVTDPVGSTTRLAYDKAGNQVSVTDPKGQTRTYEYDGRNRRTKTVFPDGTFTATAYDALGRRRSETDQAGDTTRFEYDCLGRLTKVTDALGQETRYDYDEVGDRVRQTDASGHLTRFEYDRLGRQTKRVLPDGLSEAMAYDGAGNVVSKTDFAGRTTTYAYDSDDRLLGRSYPDGSATSFSYTPTGRRQTATDGRGATTYAYDQRDRLLSLTYPDGRKLDYAYDGNGSRTSLTARIGATSLTTTYAYDDASRLAAVTDPVGRVYGHGYDQNGSRASLAYPDGTATTYGYDRLNRLTSLITTGPLGLVQSYGFTLGPAGNRLRIDEGDGTARAYRYDDLHRLTTETVTRGALPDYEKTFTYDPVGNRRTQATTGAGSPGTPTAPGTSSYTYDERDRLLTETGVNYGSDDNGSLVTKSAEATYVWDFNNWLVRVEKGDGTVVTHAYDADGNRVQTKVTPATGPPTVTNFLLDVAGSLSQVVAETNEGGALEAYYVRGHDLLAVMRPDGGGGFSSRFYHADGLGSVRRLTDETGNITDGYTYTAFGEPIGHTGSDPQPYQFAGEPYSPNIGFAYHRARWMAPSLGRFVSSDPVAGNVLDPPSLHRYTYAADDPVDRIDPTGLQSPAVLGTFIHAHIRGMYPGFGNLLQGAIPGIPEILFPDIADLLTKEVIEIKPLGLYGLSTGPSQLLLYIDALNSVGTYIPWIGTGWHPGLWSPTPGPYIEPRTATTYFVLGNDGGLLFYWAPTRRLPDRVLERVAEKVREAVRDARRVTEQALQQLASQLDVIAIADLIEAAALLSALAVGFYVLAAMMSSVMATRFAFAVL